MLVGVVVQPAQRVHAIVVRRGERRLGGRPVGALHQRHVAERGVQPLETPVVGGAVAVLPAPTVYPEHDRVGLRRRSVAVLLPPEQKGAGVSTCVCVVGGGPVP